MTKQVRLRTLQEDGSYKHSLWTDLSSSQQFDYLEQSLDRWRKKGWEPNLIKYEFRTKPDLFRRLREWWNDR